MFCDMTVLWIYIVSGCCNCFTFSSFNTFIRCVNFSFTISNILNFWFNWRFYYFILRWNFDNSISRFFRTNWFTFTYYNLSSIRIHSVSCCDSVFTIFTFNSSWGCTFFFRTIFFINYWRRYYSLIYCRFFHCSISSNSCWSYLTCFWINFIGSGINHIATFRIFRLFNLSFRTNFNNCLTCWGDYWIANVFCDMTVLWIYIVSGCCNCFTFSSFNAFIRCVNFSFTISNILNFRFNHSFYYFVLRCDFDNCFCRIHYYWFSYSFCNSACSRINTICCCGSA